jgi:Antitoxin VbhA
MTPKSPLTEPETTFASTAMSRADAIRVSIANTEIDGGAVLPETRALMDRWASGELSDDELLAAGLRLYGRQE